MPEHLEPQSPDRLWNFARECVLWVDILVVIGLSAVLALGGVYVELRYVEPFLIKHHLMNPRF